VKFGHQNRLIRFCGGFLDTCEVYPGRALNENQK
jgi:hypothetical protein